MRSSAIAYLSIARQVLLAPVTFFRNMSITEGIRQATYYALLVYYLRCLIFFVGSYQQGYFFDPRFQAIPPVSAAAFIMLSLVPFLLLLILYSQSIFLYRIANFFGGSANLEAAYKIFAFVLFLSLFQFIPVIGTIAHIYAILMLVIGVREVFNVDWISSALALFFSFVFTAVLYLLFFFVPAYILKMVFVSI